MPCSSFQVVVADLAHGLGPGYLCLTCCQENSLLHLAVREAAGGSDASLAVVTALLDARADVHACDGQGRPAMELAEPSKSLRHILLEAAATQAASAASPMDAAPLRLRVPVKGIPAASPAPEEEDQGFNSICGFGWLEAQEGVRNAVKQI